MIRYLAILLFAVLAIPAGAQQTIEPIMGIRLGQPLKGQFSECSIKRDNWCRTDPDSDNRTLLLNPPDFDSPTGLPSWVKVGRIIISPNSDGLIDQFRVESHGPRVQDRVIDSIRGRFGEPYRLMRSEAQTNSGVKMEVADAAWKNDQIAITHICTSINSCSITFYTAERYKKHLELMEQRRKRDKL